MNARTSAAMYDHMLAEYPSEACGLIYIRNGREVYMPCKNISETASEHFIMDPRDYASAESLGEIVALVHSHPDISSRASEGDLVNIENTGLRWVIVSVFHGVREGDLPYVASVNEVLPTGYIAPLVGRSFSHGILDCYSIIRDWYKRKMEIELPNFERRDKWWDDGEDLYTDNFGKAGFVQVPYEDITKVNLQIGDVILMQINAKVPNHAAVYVGDGKILQHMYGKLSTQDVYGGYWVSVTRAIVRRPQ